MRLHAGAAKVKLTPVDHPVPLAGFGPRPAFAREVESDLHARAVSLRGVSEIASGCDRVVLVSVDMLIVPRKIVREVRARVRDIERTELILTATHTHSGIGGFWEGGLPEYASIGPYDAVETARVVSSIAACIRSAVAAERPARLAFGARKLGELVASRVSHSRVTDGDLLALALDDERGDPIARLVFFAAHPTELYGVHLLSASWPGALCAELEPREGVALLFQQGVGDQRTHASPAVYQNVGAVISSGKVAISHAYGKTVALAAREVLAARPRSERSTLRFARAPFELPPPTLGACPLPFFDRVIGAAVALPYWPRKAELSAVRLGGVLLVFSPFEVVAPSSVRAKRRLRAEGFEEVAVVSLADGWLGYAPDFLPFPWTTSGAASFGGVGLGYALSERLAELGERLKD